CGLINKDVWNGVTYTSNVGGYTVAPLATMFVSAPGETELTPHHIVSAQSIANAATCWNRYDRHATLYARFGNDVVGLDKNLKLYDYCARDFQLFDSTGPDAVKIATTEGGEGGFEFLVHGLIPRGAIVLLAGTGGTGKSSLAHKLCTLVATDWNEDEQPLWIGQKVNKSLSKGVCIYFAGEDGPAIINARNEIFDPQKRAQRLMFQSTNFTDTKGGKVSFAEFLGRLKQMPEVPLLVIDPARKYLTGDEDDAAVVSEFFEAIEKFAHERNTSVIVVHHLSKGAKPKSARDVLDELRGSQVFIDRPRVVIGMFREGPKTIVGLGKCNIPPSLGMVTVERVFAHNPQTLDLTQLPGKEGIRDPYQMPADDQE
ncbi:MAG: AAA family ATPase, partial [Rickettsiales bacterium]